MHGVFTVGLGAEQVVSGLSLTILGLGLAAYLGKDYVGLPPGAELVRSNGEAFLTYLGSDQFS